MSSPQKQKIKVTEIVDTTVDPENISDSDSEQGDVTVPSTSQKKKKKKTKKIAKLSGRRKDEVSQGLVDRAAVGSDDLSVVNLTLREATEQSKIINVVKGKALGGLNKKDIDEHKFWATQPVPQRGEGPPEDDGYIEPSKPRDQVRQEPYPLPKDFEWTTLDIEDPKQIKEIHDLLSLNYVEDGFAAFRFQYSPEFLAWALKPPGYHKEWHIGVRVSSNKKLVAFISGVPISLRVRQNLIQVSEINYLCVHKKLRSKRLAPVLIKEVTRQCNLKGIFQAIYTAGVVIPTPISICQYYHRSLNIPKLVDTRFCYVPRDMTLARLKRLHKLPTTTSLKGLREMEEKDIAHVANLFTRYMARFEMVPIYTVEELRHQLLSGMGEGEMGSGGVGRRNGQVTWSYVVEDPDTGKITDFFSFYSLPSTVINNLTNPILEAAYLYYYATEAGLQHGDNQEQGVKQQLMLLIGDALIIANEARFDVFNALTLMDNVPVLQDLKFGVGDGFLNFYLYNWRTANLAGMNSEGSIPAGKGVGVVML